MSEFLKFFFSWAQVPLLLGAGITLGLAVRDTWKDGPRWRSWLTFAAGILLYGGSVWSSWSQEKADSEAARLQKENGNLLSKQLELVEENKILSTRISDVLTGGHAYCTFFPTTSATNIFSMALCFQGSGGPIRDVNVHVYSKFPNPLYLKTPYRVTRWTRVDGSVYDELDVGTVYHKQGVSQSSFSADLSGLDWQRFDFYFFALSGSWKQTVQLIKVDGNWEYASTVMPDHELMIWLKSNQYHSGKYPTNLLQKVSRVYDSE